MAPKRVPKRLIQVKNERIANILSTSDIEDAGKLISPRAPAPDGPNEFSDYSTCALRDRCAKSTETTEKVAMSDNECFEGRGKAKDTWSKEISGTVCEKAATKETITTNPVTSGTHHELTDYSATSTLTNAKAFVEVAGACSNLLALPSSMDLAWASGHDRKDFLVESADAIGADPGKAAENSLLVGAEIEEAQSASTSEDVA